MPSYFYTEYIGIENRIVIHTYFGVWVETYSTFSVTLSLNVLSDIREALVYATALRGTNTNAELVDACQLLKLFDNIQEDEEMQVDSVRLNHTESQFDDHAWKFRNMRYFHGPGSGHDLQPHYSEVHLGRLS
ncbi:hypothetical protein LIER_42078 [Lithospermum erythrorhizon]|uniref:Uncharacterized protein n=1 Tax=Lithospermum erythrorhizon TaxID=34254 RepID=A0AAV3RM77_LITER